MNAALRAFVRSALWEGYAVFGIQNGYEGLLAGDIRELTSRDMGMIINQGGTMLGTSRSAEFQTEAGLQKASAILKGKRIDALCVVGGDGSFRGMVEFAKYYDGQLIGIPGTIDNDIQGTDYTIGFDTAVQTAVEAIDKLRDTALSHGRIFFVEVMGRHSGQIALSVALASGAEDVVIPEEPTDADLLGRRLTEGRQKGKRFGIVVVAEGDDSGGAFKLADVVKEKTGLSIRVSVLGHIQRGGSPTVYDRVWGSRMGESAVRFVKQGMTGVFTAMRGGEIVPAALTEAGQGVRAIDPAVLELVRVMGR